MITVFSADEFGTEPLEIAAGQFFAIRTETGQIFRIEMNEYGGLRVQTVEGPLGVVLTPFEEHSEYAVDLIEVIPNMATNPMDIH